MMGEKPWGIGQGGGQRGCSSLEQINALIWGRERSRDQHLNTSVGFGFPWWSDGKESTCNVGDLGSSPGLGRSPGEGNGNPLQDSCLENPRDRGDWWATVHGAAKSQARLRANTFTSIVWGFPLAEATRTCILHPLCMDFGLQKPSSRGLSEPGSIFATVNMDSGETCPHKNSPSELPCEARTSEMPIV